MPPSRLPSDEVERLAALHAYEVLDSQCEASFDNIARLAAKLTGSPIALVSLVDADRQWFKAHHGLEVTETPRDLSFCAHAILTPEAPLVVPDARLDQRFSDNPLVTGTPDIRFYAGAPLVNTQGHALGTLCVIDRVPREFTADQQDTLTSLAATVTTTLELRRAMNQVRHLALADSLTGLGNHRAFLDALDKALAHQKRSGDAFALLYMDLDGFKQINDRQGHAAGDQVLREVATILRASLRREDVVARLGGDEFAALLVGCGDRGAEAGERIRTALEGGLKAAGWPVTASVGVVSFQAPPSDAARALAAADDLMYAAKLAGKNRVLHRDCFPSEEVSIAA